MFTSFIILLVALVIFRETIKKRVIKMNEKEILVNEVKCRDIVFGYFHIPTYEGNGSGRVCVALKRPPRNSESSEYLAAFSFCSPLDNFSSKFARTRTLSQLANSGARVLKFNATTDSKRLREVFVQALKLAVSTDKPNLVKHLPLEDRKIAPRWLLENKQIGKIRFGARSKFQTVIPDSEIF